MDELLPRHFDPVLRHDDALFRVGVPRGAFDFP